MSTRKPRRPLTVRRAVLALVVETIAIVSLWALFTATGDDDFADGIVTGGVIILVLAAIAFWRVLRRPDRTGTASRAMAGVQDERDKAIVTGAFTWTGYAALVCVVAAAIAVALGADPLHVLQLVTIAVYAVPVGAFVVLSRRT